MALGVANQISGVASATLGHSLNTPLPLLCCELLPVLCPYWFPIQLVLQLVPQLCVHLSVCLYHQIRLKFTNILLPIFKSDLIFVAANIKVDLIGYVRTT